MLHVNGGEGEMSYANNSLLSRKVLSSTWLIAKEAISKFCHQSNFPTTTFTMAELGCSCGPNALLIASNLVERVEEIRKRLQKNALEYQILLNDLHGNDFNAIFRSLPSFLEELKTKIGAHDSDFGPCFFNGVPGSFYFRLFPTNSVHFFHSTYTLHWLSRVPEGIENKNKGKIFISSTSPKSVVEAYYKQFQMDFSMFLKCRAEELVIDGHMILTMLGRTSEEPWSKECTSFWEFLSLALNTMVAEGLVEEEKVDLFNIPNYMPSWKEVEAEVLEEGRFGISHLQVSKIDWDFSDDAETKYDFAKCVRSVIESLLISHFGEAIIDELFRRYKKIIVEKRSEERLQITNLTISLIKIK
ncbi:hypothetical protein IC582_010505 [Cucumis melo]|uniref:Salicylate carboxymethyltransferase-like n=1 Tax=Cucumis melo TaxID=3656 RepID=A0ABM3KRI8_CUCME|nr:salicylate carboxymethyltransferase-like [Cucumis melo]